MKKLTLLLIVILKFNITTAQWEQTSGPLGGYINCMASEGANVYIGTNQDVYRSTNFGNNWEATNSSFDQSVRSIAVMGSVVFVGTYDEGIIRSMDKGNSWSKVNNGLIYRNSTINSLSRIGTQLFAGTEDGVYFSRDSGRLWLNVTNNLKDSYVMSLFGSGTDIYACGYGGVSRSADSGRTWQFIWDMDLLSPKASLSSFAADSNYLVVGTLGGGLFYSNDFGKSWKVSKSIFWEVSISAIIVKDNSIYASGGYENGAVFVSNNFGQSWNRYELGIINTEVNVFSISGSNIYAGTDGGMYLSTDGSKTWKPINEGLKVQTISSIIPVNNGILTGTYTNGMYQSINNGNSWEQINNGLETKEVLALISDGTNVYCGTDEGMYLSKDQGKTWKSKKSGDPYIWKPFSFAIQDSRIFAGTGQRIIIVSDDKGETWNQYNNEVAFPPNEWSSINAILVEDSVMIAGAGHYGIFTSFDHGMSWINTLKFPNVFGYGVLSFLRVKNRILAASTEGIYVSDNSGYSWKNIGSGIPYNVEVYSLLKLNNGIYAGTDNGVYRSDDQGINWKNVSQGLMDNARVFSLMIKDQFLYAGIYNGSVWRLPLTEVLGVSKIENKMISTIYPNPTSKLLNVVLDHVDDRNFKITLSDIYGKSIISKELSSNQNKLEFQLDMEDYINGVYLLAISSQDYQYCEKIIKQ